MECLSAEQMAAYLRGRGPGRPVESHVRECPSCAMGLLLARETLHELGARSLRPATDRLRRVGRPARPWIPWAAAAAVLFGAILTFALVSETPPEPPVVRHETPPPRPEVLPAVPRFAPEVRKSQPEAPPVPAPPAPPPEAPKRPEPRSEPPRPVPPPDPGLPPPAPRNEPKSEPKTPAPTLVERTAVARVTRTAGGAAPGRTLFAGDTLQTGRQEFVEVALDGFGSLYFRENSKAELGLSGEIRLHDGGMLARLDPGRRLGVLKTPGGDLEVQSTLFDVQASRGQTEVSVADGTVSIGSVVSKGPGALLARTGKAAEPRALDPGFASWLPDRLAVKRFSGWFEGEAFTSLQGWKVVEMPQASGGRAAVQAVEGATAGLRTAFPFRGRYALWLRMRAYENRSTLIGIHLNGQALGEVKLEPEAKPWRWVGPFFVASDRLELAVTALGRLSGATPEKTPSPVAIDAAWVTSDAKATPPDRLAEDRRAFDFGVDEPSK